jgi:lipopolysaccharide export system permease protein
VSLLARYLIRENLKVLLWIFAILILLCFLIDLVERGDDLLEAGVPISEGLYYLILRLPQNIVYILPIAALLGSFITLGLLGRNHELLAINASGISGHFVARPLLFVGACLSLISFFWAENVVPPTTREASRIWQVEVEKNPQRSLLRHNEVWFRTMHAEGMILYHIGFLKLSDSALGPPAFKRASKSPTVMKDVMVLRLAPDFSLIDRTDAEGMVWEGDHWHLLGVFIIGGRSRRTFQRKSTAYTRPTRGFSMDRSRC